MPFTVRQAGPADAPAIIEFNRLLAEESEGKTLDAAVLEPGVAAVLADPRKGLYFLAEEDRRPVGQMGLTFEWSDWRNGWFWWIQSVYVRREARRKGVFRALYRHIEEMARRDREVIGLRLYVEDANEAAQKTYHKLGMTRTGYVLLEKYPLVTAAPPQTAVLEARRPPAVFVLAGSNGAGKTTASRTLLAERMKLLTFVNADIIAQGLGGFNRACPKFCVNDRFPPFLLPSWPAAGRHAVFKQDCEVVKGQFPIADRHRPFPGRFVDRHVHNLQS